MKNVNNTAPCKDCKSRKLGCHSICTEYVNWAEENARERQRRYEEKGIHHDLETMHVRSAKKGVRRRNSPK